MRRPSLLVASVLAAAVATMPASANERPVVAGDLRSPESAAWHPESASWFVSNMGGVSFDLGPDARKGFLTRVQGTTATGRWLAGLERPRGVSAGTTHLYVAEPNTVAVVEIASATIVKRIAVPGGNGDLNDVVVDRKTREVFVSSPSAGAIFRITEPLLPTTMVEVFVQDPLLTSPNGLTLADGFIAVAGLGSLSPPSIGNGRVVHVDRVSKGIEQLTPPLGILDGIVKDGDDYLVTEWATGNVYRVARDGSVLIEMKLAPSAADLGIDPARRVIMVPETLANAAVVVPLL